VEYYHAGEGFPCRRGLYALVCSGGAQLPPPSSPLSLLHAPFRRRLTIWTSKLPSSSSRSHSSQLTALTATPARGAAKHIIAVDADWRKIALQCGVMTAPAGMRRPERRGVASKSGWGCAHRVLWSLFCPPGAGER